MIRILHVSPDLSPRLGGSVTAALNLCRALARLGVAVTIYTTELDEVGSWSPRHRPRVLHNPAGRMVGSEGLTIRYFSTSWPSRFAYSPELDQDLQKNIGGYDLVHIHRLYRYPSMAAMRRANQRGIPYIVSPHGVLHPFHRSRRRLPKLLYNSLVEKRNLDRAAAIHYETIYELECAKSLRLTAPTIVIPSAIDPEEFAYLPPKGGFRVKHPELADKRLVVFLGRLAPQKGLDLLIQAFAVLAASRRDIHLVIAGPDSEGYGKTVMGWLHEHAMTNRATLVGPLFGSEKLALLSDADAWVLPSYAENFGIAVVEALACGLPIVISDRVGIHSEIAAAGAGIVVPCDSGLLAAALTQILEDSSLRQRLGKAGPELVRQKFTWDVVASRMLGIYRQILSRHPNPIPLSQGISA